jgi:hypothetical protein
MVDPANNRIDADAIENASRSSPPPSVSTYLEQAPDFIAAVPPAGRGAC